MRPIEDGWKPATGAPEEAGAKEGANDEQPVANPAPPSPGRQGPNASYPPEITSGLAPSYGSAVLAAGEGEAPAEDVDAAGSST
jgi:hypothetical protein